MIATAAPKAKHSARTRKAIRNPRIFAMRAKEQRLCRVRYELKWEEGSIFERTRPNLGSAEKARKSEAPRKRRSAAVVVHRQRRFVSRRPHQRHRAVTSDRGARSAHVVDRAADRSVVAADLEHRVAHVVRG